MVTRTDKMKALRDRESAGGIFLPVIETEAQAVDSLPGVLRRDSRVCGFIAFPLANIPS